MKMKASLRQTVFDLLDKSVKTQRSEKLYDGFTMILIALNVIAVVVEPSARDRTLLRLLHGFEAFSIAVFSVEYLLRLWVSGITYPARSGLHSGLRYLLSPMALVDLAAILPFYLPLLLPVDLRVLRVFRIFRTLRIFKANRYTNALATVLQVIRNKADQLVSSLFVVFSLMLVASVLMFNIENAAQPEQFTSVLDALLWSSTVLSNVSFGNLAPVTVAGRVLGSIVGLLGVGAIAIPTGILASGFTELSQKSIIEAQEINAAPGLDYPACQPPGPGVPHAGKQPPGSAPPSGLRPMSSRPVCPHCGLPVMLVPDGRAGMGEGPGSGSGGVLSEGIRSDGDGMGTESDSWHQKT